MSTTMRYLLLNLPVAIPTPQFLYGPLNHSVMRVGSLVAAFCHPSMGGYLPPCLIGMTRIPLLA